MPFVFGYCRVSTRDQVDTGRSATGGRRGITSAALRQHLTSGAMSFLTAQNPAGRP